MSQNNDSNDIDHATAVAAAAYAISSLKDLGIQYQKEEPGTSKITSKSKKEEATISIQEPGRASKRFSGQGTMKSSEYPASMVPATSATDTKKPEKTLLPAPSFRKTASALDMELSGDSKVGRTASKPEVGAKPPNDRQLSRRFETETSTSKPNLATTEKPASLPPPPQPKRQSSTGPGMRKTQADAWEEAEMARIKERYEKQIATILDWEQKKKAKAKRHAEKSERKLEEKRAKDTKKNRNEMQYIDQVAGGARAKAEKKKMNDELKIKEKANTIRRTGVLPKTCFCF
ncbi:uncharacterized protein At3g61260-like isoform X2 [Humulus lupulus]|nr:uncharacterized protein At3g61260-like isoform X2 [Humulus lupulus]